MIFNKVSFPRFTNNILSRMSTRQYDITILLFKNFSFASLYLLPVGLIERMELIVNTEHERTSENQTEAFERDIFPNQSVNKNIQDETFPNRQFEHLSFNLLFSLRVILIGNRYFIIPTT